MEKWHLKYFPMTSFWTAAPSHLIAVPDPRPHSSLILLLPLFKVGSNIIQGKLSSLSSKGVILVHLQEICTPPIEQSDWSECYNHSAVSVMYTHDIVTTANRLIVFTLSFQEVVLRLHSRPCSGSTFGKDGLLYHLWNSRENTPSHSGGKVGHSTFELSYG